MYVRARAMSNRTLPQQIRDARMLARLTQQELADRVGVERQSVSQWEHGKQEPGDANMAALRRELGSAFGSEADATFSTLQRLHGQSVELEALNRYLLERQAAFSAALSAAARPYHGDDRDDDQPEAALIPPAPRAPAPDAAQPPAPRAQRRRTGR